MKLTDICDFQGGSQPPKEEWSFDEQEGYIRMLQIRDFTQGERVTPEYIKISNTTKTCEANDILIARYGASIGKILTGLAGAYNVAIMRTIPDTSRIKKQYLYYYLKSSYFQNAILNVGSRAAQAGFNKEDLSKLDIECPELIKQDKIIAVLEKIEDIIEKRKIELSDLDTLIKARFVEMFGDRYVNDKKWNTTKLGESISFNNGKAHEQVVDENGDYILVTSRAIASDFEDVRRTNTLLFPLHKNDIVMVMSDVPNGKALAKCQLIDSDDKYTLNQRICSFDNYEYNTIFLLHLLNRHPYFLSFNDGNGQTNLRKNDILECELIVPPFELQNQFADCVKQVNKSKVAVQKALTETQLLFDSLMQQYFG